jgi:hypothetical protein
MDVGSSMNPSSPGYSDLAHGTAVKSLAGTGDLLADYNISSHPLLDSQNSIKVQQKQKSGWHFVEHHTGIHFLTPWQPTPEHLPRCPKQLAKPPRSTILPERKTTSSSPHGRARAAEHIGTHRTASPPPRLIADQGVARGTAAQKNLNGWWRRGGRAHERTPRSRGWPQAHRSQGRSGESGMRRRDG